MPYAYVIVLTGRADAAAARAAMQAGADDLVIKPLDTIELERKLIAAERMTGPPRRSRPSPPGELDQGTSRVSAGVNVA